MLLRPTGLLKFQNYRSHRRARTTVIVEKEALANKRFATDEPFVDCMCVVRLKEILGNSALCCTPGPIPGQR